MKRDNDYLRELLFKTENSDDYLIFAIPTLGMSPGEQKAYYHIQLLSDAGYVVKVRDTENSGHRLTFQGHDFIEAIRDEGIWEKTKKTVAETGGNATLEMVKAIASGLLKKKLSEHAGIDL